MGENGDSFSEVAMELKPGSRLRSVVCDTEVVVVRAPGQDVDLRCGGSPMIPVDAEAASGVAPAAGHAGGTLLGKRYGDEEVGIEVLATKAGAGSLSLGDEPLPVKGAKPLPASD
jgi:hypothetical protein